MPFAGGLIQHGYQCGMIWGAVLAAGAQAYRSLGSGSQAEVRAIAAARMLVRSFRNCNKYINCLEITDLDKSSSTWQVVKFFLLKGGSIGCMRMAARYAPVAVKEINTVFSAQGTDAPAPPVSCAAMLAKKLGTSDLHAVMVAGFAGGIGLCGGACGALGAAIWIHALDSIKKHGGKVDFKDPAAENAIERFLKRTDFDFECYKIVGREFTDIADHADYLRGGGCSEVIEALANA